MHGPAVNDGENTLVEIWYVSMLEILFLYKLRLCYNLSSHIIPGLCMIVSGMCIYNLYTFEASVFVI